MHSYFISDLHLTPERPQITQAFFSFLQQISNEQMLADKLYILGDLFEFWIGDDAATMLGADPVLDAMGAISKKIDCYFIAGNRDFLVRNNFSERTGFTILQDETVVDLYGTKTLILHGDSLCTDDIAHQQFRQQMMTNTAFCDNFLNLPIPQRIEQAKLARMQSNEHKSQVSMGIMDVTESSVINAFAKHNVTQMIHGHTHRQATHHYKEGALTRIVLGDWDKTSSIMRIDKQGFKIENFAI